MHTKVVIRIKHSQLYLQCGNAIGVAMRRIFLSFQMENKKQVDGIRLFKWNKGFPLEFYDESVRIAYKSNNTSYIKAQIKPKIQRCSATICFLGQTTWQSELGN